MRIPIRNVLTPFQAFVRSESAGSIILLLTAAGAFLWANSPWAGSYLALKHFGIDLGLGQWRLHQTLFHWVNDGLMVLFFLLVGLEIKREVRGGELSDLRVAALPVLAAVGGMVIPALIYVAINAGGAGLKGWGIPMATDIAFALGIMQLLGRRVPTGLRVFLTALAIADDLGAVVIIALFYSHGFHWVSLALVGLFWLAALAYGRTGGRRLAVYAVLGLGMWYFMLRSGVHATVAGILLALAVPMDRRAGEDDAHSTPLYRLEHLLSPWVAYLVIPLFALLNAGFSMGSEAGLTESVTLGALLGLFIGKPVGIMGMSWLTVRLGLGELPYGTSWRHMAGAAALAGIGFTMSLFVADLAFQQPQLLNYAKLGILTASLASASLGFFLLLGARAP